MLLHGQSIVGNSRFLNSLALDLVGCMHSILSVSRFKVVKSYDFINKKKNTISKAQTYNLDVPRSNSIQRRCRGHYRTCLLKDRKSVV